MRINDFREKLERVLKSLKSIFSPTKNESGVKVAPIKDVEETIADINWTNEQKEIFDRLQTGDLIYAQMPLSDKELEKVPEGHRTRPYYVIYKSKNVIDAFMCSSSPFNISDGFSTFTLYDCSYEGLTKTTYIDLGHIFQVPVNNIIRYLGPVNDNDFEEINRRFYKKNKKYYIEHFGETTKYSSLSPGDIIQRKDKNYIIVAFVGLYCRVVRINDKSNAKRGDCFYVYSGKHPWKVKINPQALFIKLSNGEKAAYTLNRGELNKINYHLEKYGGANCIPKGCIFNIGDICYYSYGSYNGKTQACLAYKEQRNSCKKIKCAGYIYYIDMRKQEIISDFSNVTSILSQ